MVLTVKEGYLNAIMPRTSHTGLLLFAALPVPIFLSLL